MIIDTRKSFRSLFRKALLKSVNRSVLYALRIVVYLLYIHLKFHLELVSRYWCWFVHNVVEVNVVLLKFILSSWSCTRIVVLMTIPRIRMKKIMMVRCNSKITFYVLYDANLFCFVRVFSISFQSLRIFRYTV